MKHFFKSLVFSVFSPTFYRESTAYGVKRALGVFFLFTFVVGIIGGVLFSIAALVGLTAAKEGFKKSNWPEKVSIENGELSIPGLEMPMVVAEGDSYIAIDTTGKITELPDGYGQAVVITKTEMMSRNQSGREQLIKYSELFPPKEGETDFEMSRSDIEGYLGTGAIILACLSPIVSVGWTWFFGFIQVLIVALIGTVVLSIAKRKEAFRDSMIFAIYAYIPLTYLNFILWLLNSAFTTVTGINLGLIFSFCCLVPLLFWLIKFFAFWSLGMIGTNQDQVRVKAD